MNKALFRQVKKFLVVVVGGYLLLGCQPNPEIGSNTDVNSPPVSIPASQGVKLTPAMDASRGSNNPVTVTSSPRDSESPTPSVESTISSKPFTENSTCLPIVWESPTSSPFKGSILYELISTFGSSAWTINAIDVESRQNVQLMDSSNLISLAPDGQHLAYYAESDDSEFIELKLLNLNNGTSNVLSQPLRLGSAITWHNGNPSIYLHYLNTEGRFEATYLTYDLTLGVPYTRTEEFLLPDYTVGLANNLFDDALTFNEERSRALYFSDPPGEKNSKMELRDLNSQSAIWQSEPVNPLYVVTSEWVQEAKVAYAFSGDVEFQDAIVYSVTRDGFVNVLIDFNGLNPEVEKDYIVSYLSWSLDGNYLSISMLDGRVFIFDVERKILRTLCEISTVEGHADSLKWISDNTLLYVIRSASGISSLRRLQVDRWEAYNLLNDANNRIEIIGWTPIEFTQ